MLASNHGAVITEGDDGYINMNFEEFNKIFGMVSDLTDDQKNPCGTLYRKKGQVGRKGVLHRMVVDVRLDAERNARRHRRRGKT